MKRKKWQWRDRRGPECGGQLDYEPEQRETRFDPGYPEKLECTECGFEPDDYEDHIYRVPMFPED